MQERKREYITREEALESGGARVSREGHPEQDGPAQKIKGQLQQLHSTMMR